MHALEDLKLAVIGLGYVGLPLAVEFGKRRQVTGFDLKAERVSALQNGIDATQEVPPEDMSAAVHLQFTTDVTDLSECNCYIVAVPTPIDTSKRPDLSPLISASETIGRVLKAGDIVIYESTVFPGATEEICVPVLEQISGLTFNTDFFGGYSPERINPGDKTHRLPDIVKVTSGSTPKTADLVDALYAQIVTAGTHRAESIRVAEAAKIIENTQRDLNIALINELAMLFDKLDLDTEAVLRAAGTKWNFLPFQPGLVGGHCIGVDPYYLTHKATQAGYHPEIILAGRRLNNGMGEYIAARMVKAMLAQDISVRRARVLVLGITFKENCPDLRNTGVMEVLRALHDYGVKTDVTDPLADATQALQEYGVTLCDTPVPGTYDGIILAVPHDAFKAMRPADIRALGRKHHVFFDLKSIFERSDSDLRL